MRVDLEEECDALLGGGGSVDWLSDKLADQLVGGRVRAVWAGWVASAQCARPPVVPGSVIHPGPESHCCGAQAGPDLGGWPLG